MVHKPECDLQEEIHWMTALQDLKKLVENGQETLEQSAAHCRERIETAIRQACSLLHAREAWLLNHLDNIENLKSSALATQEAELANTLSELEKLTGLEEMDVTQSEARECYERIFNSMHSVGWQPSEGVVLDFDIDMAKFEEIVINLGRVVIKEDDREDEREDSELTDMEVISPLAVNEDTDDLSSKPKVQAWLVSLERQSDAPTFQPSAHEILLREVKQYFQEIRNADFKKWLLKSPLGAGYWSTSDGELQKVLSTGCTLMPHFYQKAKEYHIWLKSKEMLHENQGSCPSPPTHVHEELRRWLRDPNAQSSNRDDPLLRRENSSACGEMVGTVQGNCWLISSMETCDLNPRDSETMSIDTASVVSSVSKLEELGYYFCGKSDTGSVKNLKCSVNKTIETFSEIRKTDLTAWLKPQNKDEMVKPDLCVWLARSSQRRCDDCPGTCVYDKVKDSVAREVTESIMKPDLCIWLANNAQQRCEDCTGSCSYDLVKSVNADPTKAQKYRWLVNASDW